MDFNRGANKRQEQLDYETRGNPRKRKLTNGKNHHRTHLLSADHVSGTILGIGGYRVVQDTDPL